VLFKEQKALGVRITICKIFYTTHYDTGTRVAKSVQ